MKFKLKAALTLLVFCVQYSLFANIISINIKNNQPNIATNSANSKAVSWSVKVNNGYDTTVSSNTIQIRAGTSSGPILLSVSKPLLKVAPAGLTDQIFKETIYLPLSIVYRARKMGYTSISIQRQFSDGNSTLTTASNFILSGSSAAGFSISKIQLKFKSYKALKQGNSIQPQLVSYGDNRRNTVTSKNTYVLGEAFSGYAIINYTGSGLIKATWEIADPQNSSSRKPIFRVLMQVTKFQPGFGVVKIATPILPTHDTGRYLLRLKITQPNIGFTTPVRSYYIKSKANNNHASN